MAVGVYVVAVYQMVDGMYVVAVYQMVVGVYVVAVYQMAVGVYVVAVYENCSTGIGFADEAFSLKGNVFNFRTDTKI